MLAVVAVPPTAALITAALLASLGLAGGAGCTGVRVREFTREAYAPAAETLPTARVFPADRGAVFSALVALLEARGARFEVRDRARGSLSVSLPWSTQAEAAAAVDLGGVHRIVTRTRRTYRSYSPLHWNCNACVVRNGRIVDQQTEPVEDRTITLDPGRYRIEARVVAALSSEPGGTRVELLLRPFAEPREPRGLTPRSTGRLEEGLIDDLEAALGSSARDLR